MAMDPLLMEIGNYAIWFFVVTSIAAMGLNLTVKEILAPWKKKWLLSISLVANFVVVPLFALLILSVIPLDIDLATGLIIVAAAAGAPSLPKAMDIVKGNVAYAIGLTMVLILVTIFYMPIMLPYLIEGVSVDQSGTALYLIVFMLLPLIITMALRAWTPKVAQKLYPVIDRVSDLSIVVVLLIYTFGLLTSDFSVKAGTLLGLKGTFVAILFILGSFGIGYVLGGPELRNREVLAFGTGFRNVSAALVVVSANFEDPQILFMVLVIAAFGIIFMMILGGWLYRRNKRERKLTRPAEI
ncbi:MAG: bile acid:sodium symporter family protein [Methanomicrobiales archaeon]|nr:bile acid:sodium symporter family protein [Methanomicrobiales archaeon]